MPASRVITKEERLARFKGRQSTGNNGLKGTKLPPRPTLPRSAREAASLLRAAGEKELWLGILRAGEGERNQQVSDAVGLVMEIWKCSKRDTPLDKLVQILSDLWDCAYKAGSATVRVRMEALKYLSDRRDGKTPVMPAQQMSKKQDSRLQEVMAKVLGGGQKAAKPDPTPLIEDAKPATQPEPVPEPALLPVVDPELAEHDALRAKSALEQRLIEHQQRKANELPHSATAIVPHKVMVQDHNQHQVDVTGSEV